MLHDSKERSLVNNIIYENPTIPSITVIRKDKLDTPIVLGENFFTFRDENSFVETKL